MLYPSRSLAAVYSFLGSRAKCPACGKIPTIGEYQSADAEEFAFYAECHGSTDVLRLPRKTVYNDAWRALAAGWLAGMFKLDALPDVRELIRYNAGAT